MFVLYSKLKMLKGKLKELNNEEFSNLFGRIRDAKNVFDQVQRNILSAPTNGALLEEEREAVSKFHLLVGLEKSFLRQKSRI